MPAHAATGTQATWGVTRVTSCCPRPGPSDVIAAVRTRDKAAGLAAAGVQVREAQTLGAKGKLRGIEWGVGSGRPG